MRMFFRSFAILALAVCASAVLTMPAAASVPIDPGLRAVASSGVDRPVQAIDLANHDVACLCAVDVLSESADHNALRSPATPALHFADTSAAVPAYRHIDPDIAE